MKYPPRKILREADCPSHIQWRWRRLGRWDQVERLEKAVQAERAALHERMARRIEDEGRDVYL